MGIFKSLEQEFDYDIIEEFVGHFQSMCDAMETLCLAIESQERYEASVQELFRIFHNLKSASGFFNIHQMHSLSALIENVLEDARAQSGKASEEFTSWLSLVTTQYEIWLQNFEEDSELADINPQILALPKKIIA